ncbi:hypothetical protein EI94DRAFT_1621782 [Lactarius quietus]|nr:hypothetical protein EI94DRAFT_1621782 [Lactarius quietus]
MGLPVVRADTSLFVPGFDPQPLSAGDLGTDGQGRTTWELVPGSLTGTFTEPVFIGTATLVEGPSDAHLVYENTQLSITMDFQCEINSGIAACTGNVGVEGDVSSVSFPTQAAQPFVVQGGGPLTVASPSQATPSVLPASPTSSGFIISATSAPSSSTTSSPSSAGSNDARSNNVVQIRVVIGFVTVMTMLLV